MNLEKQKAFIIRFVFIVLILGLSYVSIQYFLPILMPFVIGFIVAAVFRPLIDVIEEKTHIKRSVVSIVILLFFYGIIIYLVIVFGAKVVSSLKDIFYQLPGLYMNTIEPALANITENFLLGIPEIEYYLEDILNNISDSAFAFISNASTTVVGSITGFASSIPSLLITVIFTIVATFFFTIDYHPIVIFIVRQFPKEKRAMVINIKNSFVSSILNFVKAYATIISITFVELSIGFLILGVSNPFLVGFLVALVDIMPILGTGGVLIPWAIIAFMFNETSFGVGMLILYIIITVVRQTIEPKVVGQQIGLHPVVTLMCMFVGAQLFGVVGLFLLPIVATILKKMNDEGTIHIFNKD